MYRYLMIAGALAAALSTAAAAAPVTYYIDQPLWGRAPVGQDVTTWQASRQAFVEANPDFWPRLTGHVTLDWTTGSYGSLALSYPVNYGGDAIPISFTEAAVDSFGIITSSGGIPAASIGLDIRFGPEQSFIVDPIYGDTVPSSLPLYRGTLLLSVYKQLDDTVTLLMQRMDLWEARQAFSFGSFGIGGRPTGGEYVRVIQGAVSQTYCCNAGVSLSAPEVAPVPLPAAGWLLVAGLGALRIAKRRRALS